MTAYVYRRPVSKKRVVITPQVRLLILALLQHYSQQRVARELRISQAAVSRVAKDVKEATR